MLKYYCIFIIYLLYIVYNCIHVYSELCLCPSCGDPFDFARASSWALCCCEAFPE